MITSIIEMRVESPAREILAARSLAESRRGYFTRPPQGENIKEIKVIVNKILYGKENIDL